MNREEHVIRAPTAADWLDNLELSHDRILMLSQVDPNSIDYPPRLWLEQWDCSRDVDDYEPGESVWLYPEDIPALIRWLTEWLALFQGCRDSDASKFPVPYWSES